MINLYLGYDCQTIRVEIKELLVDLDFFYREYFTNEHISRYDSLRSKCSTDIKTVSLVEWLTSSTFEKKYNSYELPKCKSKRLGNLI